MGFTVYYRSTEPLDQDRADAIHAAAEQLNGGRAWLSCEPVNFFMEDEEGCLVGGSKPSFMPHPNDVASAAAEGLPDGTLNDVVQVLCQLSRGHQVDWEFSHDEDPGPIGFIRAGKADQQLIDQLQAIGEIANLMANFEGGFEDLAEFQDESEPSDDSGTGEDDEEFPPTIRIWPR